MMKYVGVVLVMLGTVIFYQICGRDFSVDGSDNSLNVGLGTTTPGTTDPGFFLFPYNYTSEKSSYVLGVSVLQRPKFSSVDVFPFSFSVYGTIEQTPVAIINETNYIATLTFFSGAAFLQNPKVETVKIVKVNLADFGMNNPCSYAQLVLAASEKGLSLCPLFLAGYLRLEYLDQPEGSYLTVATKKPNNEHDYPNGFYLRNHENALWLQGYRADDVCEWPNQN